MSGPMKKNKLVARFDFDLSLLAVVSHLKEYKIAWHLNEQLGINLAKQEDEIFEFLGDVRLFISNYSYQTEHSTIRLLGNRSLEESSSSKQYLIPELKQFDYLILTDGSENSPDAYYIRDQLRNLKGIQLVSVIEIEQLKSKENLIF